MRQNFAVCTTAGGENKSMSVLLKIASKFSLVRWSEPSILCFLLRAIMDHNRKFWWSYDQL